MLNFDIFVREGRTHMNSSKPMPVLLIEDDISECEKFKDYIQTRDDVRLVGVTGSSAVGVELVKKHLPETVILDLELRHGQGSGVAFLLEIQKIKLVLLPLIVAITNISSETILDHARQNGLDFVFSKAQADYEPKIIIDFALDLRPTIQKRNQQRAAEKGIDLSNVESPEERKRRISEKIENEMDLIGIPNQFKGREYSINGIYFLITYDPNAEGAIPQTVFDFLAKKHGKADTSIGRAIQTAIRKAWAKTPIDELITHYTDRVDYNTGIPTPLEFLTFYAKKIRKMI